MSELWFVDESKTKAKTGSYQSLTGRLETEYLHKPFSGSSKKYIYNKQKDSLEKGLEPEFGDVPHLRLEIRRERKKKYYGLNHLYKANNPFGKLVLYDSLNYQNLHIEKPLWGLFYDSCRQRGIDNAIKYFNSEYQDKLKAALDNTRLSHTNIADHYKSGIWRHKKLWGKTWKEAVLKSGILSDPFSKNLAS